MSHYIRNVPAILDVSGLTSYIQAQYPNASNVMYHADTPPWVDVTTSSTLSATAQTALNSYIDAYPNPAPTTVVPYYFKCSGMDAKTTSSTSWTTLFWGAYQGQQVSTLGTLKEVRIASYLQPSLIDDSASSNFYYDVQLTDLNNNVIATGHFTNKVLAIQIMTVAAAPQDPGYFQLQVKKGLAGAQVVVNSFCYKHEVPY